MEHLFDLLIYTNWNYLFSEEITSRNGLVKLFIGKFQKYKKYEKSNIIYCSILYNYEMRRTKYILYFESENNFVFNRLEMMMI